MKTNTFKRMCLRVDNIKAKLTINYRVNSINDTYDSFAAYTHPRNC